MCHFSATFPRPAPPSLSACLLQFPRHATVGPGVRRALFYRSQRPMGNRLYVGNLSFDSTEDSIRAAFGADGRSVSEVTVMMDRDTGRPRGFGFVEMGSSQDAQSAIQALDGSDLDGRTIKVNEAKERQPRGGGGGGGHGGGGGGGGDRW